MKSEIEHLHEVIRQKKALVKSLEADLRGVRQSLDESIERVFLLRLLSVYENKISDVFDPALSRKIDAVHALLEG